MEKAFARKIGADAAELLHPVVAWEEAELLLERAWPSKDQPQAWMVMRFEVHAGWLAAVEKIDRQQKR